MPDANLRAEVLARLKVLNIVGSTATTFTQANMANTSFTGLFATNKNIVNLTGLGYATNLTQLFLDSNKISDISEVSKLTNLTELNVSFNGEISDISAVAGLTNLVRLNCGDARVSDISAVANLTKLTVLSLNNNNISDISAVAGLTALTNLDLTSNKISNISAVAGLTNLTTLYLNSNSISDISAVASLTNLKQLHLRSNSIRNISAVSRLTMLTHLYLRDNSIRNISAVSRLTMLTKLRLSNNKISDISAVESLINLTQLWIARNKISTTDALLPLTKLEELDIAGHRITDVGEFQKLSKLRPPAGMLECLYLEPYPADCVNWDILGDPVELEPFLWMRPSSIDAEQAVTSENYLQNPPIETFPFTIRFSEPVYGFQMDDIIVETELHTGTGTATLEALTPTIEPAQIYTATIRLPDNAAGRLRIIVRAGAAETDDGRIDPTVDRVFPWIAFSTLPEPPRKRKIIYQCPVGWQRTDSFARKTQRVIIYEVNLQMDMRDRVSIYKPISVVIYVHPDEALENLDGWKLHVGIPYNHHRDYLLTAENAVVVDANIEGVEGGFAFIESPEEAPFPMVGMGFTGAHVPGFDYRLCDDTGRKVDFGIACYKRGDIFQVLKEMEDPRVLRNVLLETLDWDAATYIRSEWTVPAPAPAAPSLIKKTVVGTWANLKKQ